MASFFVEATRGSCLEERHRVHAVVVDADGDVRASAHDPEYVSFWRSAAKPFQALASLREGVMARFGWGADVLALACGSHSSEGRHVALAARLLADLGASESDLACGPHRPLSDAVARDLQGRGVDPTPLYSNCSGKHAVMLGLASHRGWTREGYQRLEHQVQQRCLREVCAWTGLRTNAINVGVDGCGVVCYGLPLVAMARAYARLASNDSLGADVLHAMTAHPELVAGEGRVCTELMRAYPGEVVTKVGASGIYCAALPAAGLGVALKVEDGSAKAAEVALLAVLGGWLDPPPAHRLAQFATPAVINTRGESVGEMRVAGGVAH